MHTVWLNREAMARLGITRDVECPAVGHVEMDAVTGEPTGYVHDFAVLGISEEGQRALEPHVPGYATDAQYDRMVASLDMAAGFGITTIVEPQNGLDDIALFARARDEGTLRSRLIAAMLCLPGTTRERLDALEEARRAHDDDRFRVGPIKLYIDDVIEPHTAAMLEPYANRPDDAATRSGRRRSSRRSCSSSSAAGFQAFTHATGDRGIRTVLDAVRGVPRGARAGATPAIRSSTSNACTPTTSPGSASWGSSPACSRATARPTSSRSGGETSARRASATPGRSARSRRAGGVLAFCSDWNVAEMDPMSWLYTAMTRADLDGNGAWNLEEAVDLATAIRASTLGSAYANFAEHDRGSLTPGKYADLVVLSRDLFAVRDPREILDTQRGDTVVGGEVVHRPGVGQLRASSGGIWPIRPAW